MTEKADILVSAIAVVRNHAGVARAFVEDMTGVLARHYVNYEVLLVDNGSTDDTVSVVRSLLEKTPCVRLLRLTRPVDDEMAIMAGLDAAIGDFVVTLHPDFDPPAETPAMVARCRGGHDLVLGIDRQPPLRGPVYSVLRQVFLAMSRHLVGIDMVTDATGYRALTRQAVNALIRVRLRRRHFAVVVADVGLNAVAHPYDRISRSGSHPRRNLLRAMRTGLSVLVHNSITPLRIASAMGLAGSGLSFLYSLYVIVVYLLRSDVMPGWTTLSLAMSGLFSLAFLMLALMGEYLGRLLEESPNRPLYHVRDELSSAVMLADLNRKNVHEASDAAQQPTASSTGELR